MTQFLCYAAIGVFGLCAILLGILIYQRRDQPRPVAVVRPDRWGGWCFVPPQDHRAIGHFATAEDARREAARNGWTPEIAGR